METAVPHGKGTPVQKRLDPWLSMWFQPGKTIRQIVDDGAGYGVLLLAALAGVTQVLDRASAESLGDELGLGAILLAAAVIGPLAGIVGIYVFAWLLRLSGGWLGGEAPSSHLRAALAWGSLPNVAGLLLWLPALALAGREMFTSTTPQLEAQPLLAIFLLPLGVAWIGLAIWSIVLFVLAIAEVQGFSGWRALGNILLAGFLFALPFFVLGVLAALVATV